MRLPRAILGALVWVLAAVVGLLGALLSVTVIGLPLGMPLLLWARRMFGTAVRLMLPSHLAHPVKESRTSSRRKGRQATKRGRKATRKSRKKSKETGKALSARSGKAVEQVSSAIPKPSRFGTKAKKRAAKGTKRVRKALR